MITLEPNRKLEHLLSGEVTVAGRAVQAGQIAWSDPVHQACAWAITLAAGDGDQPSVVMLYSGQPIGQPVALGGPVAMETKTEMTQAFNDFHSGKFGDIPGRPA